MRLFGSLGLVSVTICVTLLLLFSPTGKLAGQTEFRPYSVRGPRSTPEMIQRTEWQRALLVEGWKVTPAEAEQLEEKLAKDSDNLTLQLRLMSYYMQQVMIEKLAGHVFWLIENHPDADVLQGSEMMTRIPAAGGGGNASVYQTRLQALWKEQANKFSNNARVLRNAATAVSSADPALAVQYVKAARQAEPRNPEWTTWLAKIYADAIRWTYWDGKSMMTFTGEAADYRHYPFMLPLPMCQDVKKEVETSTDAALVGAVGEMLIRQARLLSTESNPAGTAAVTPDVAQIASFGEALAERARGLTAAARKR